MSGEAYGLLVLSLLVAAGDWYAVAQRDRRLEYLCKPLVPLLLIALVVEMDPRDANAWSWFLVALAFSLVGDILLMLPRDMFKAVIGLFLLAELSYVGGLLFLGMHGVGLLVGTVAGGVGLVLAAPVILQGVQKRQPVLLPSVKAYIGVVSAMVVAAFAAGRLVGILGACLFYASNVMTGWDRFVRGDQWRRPPREAGEGLVADPLRVATVVTYHLGQVGLVLALV
jgi:alkenylglycerophosphocholine/alkenylglycerophosphoethanolamine hydrolase